MKYHRGKKNKLKIFTIIYSLVIMLAAIQVGSIVFTAGIFAVDEWDVTERPSTGLSVSISGDNSTYKVGTPEALSYAIYVASATTTDVNLTIELVNSINMAARYWKPRYINNSKLTKLTIKGNGHTIEGLKFYSGATDSTSTTHIGLIGVMAKPLFVENLNLRVLSTKEVTVSTTNANFGALMGATNNNDITVENCSVYGTIESSNLPSGIGGLIGYVNAQGMKSVTNCWSYCTIKLTNKGHGVGGIIGVDDGTINTFSNCAKFEGDISSTVASTIGGLIGISDGISTINKCFNNAKLTSSSGAVGGIVGKLNKSGATINYCYNNADLSCGSGTVIGGLVGSGSSLTFNNCYHNGELKKADETLPLNKDDNYNNKTIATYTLDNDDNHYKSIDSSWRLNYDSSFEIMNNGGNDSGNNGGNNGGNNSGSGTKKATITLTISSLEKAGAFNFIASSLCGNSATYNNSFCRNTSYSSSINFGHILKVSLKLVYNGSNSHQLNDLLCYSDGSTNNYYYGYYTTIKECNRKYYLDKSSNKSLMDSFSSSCESAWFKGLQVDVNDNVTQLTIAPWFGYYYKTSAGLQESGGMADSGKKISISLSGVDVKIINNDIIVSNTSDIKLSTLGSAFTTASGKNGGLPILKDFYWEYA